MRSDRPLEAVLVLHRRTSTARSTVLAAGFEPMAECDTAADGLVLTALYRPDLVVVDTGLVRSTAERSELVAVAEPAEVVLVTPGADPSILAADLAAARRRLADRGEVASRAADRGLHAEA